MQSNCTKVNDSVKLLQAKSAEGQLVGACLIDPSLVSELSRFVGPRDFVDPFHREAVGVLIKLNRAGTPIDEVTIKSELAKSSLFTKDSSPALYLAQTGLEVTTSAHFGHYLKVVVEARRKRQLCEIATAARDAALNGQASRTILNDLWASIDDMRRDDVHQSRFTALTAAELDSGDYRLNWLIDYLLVEGQPCIVAGSKKSLKTTLLLAMFISLAIGAEFLGKFRIRGARRVLLCSGESGLSTLQETARRVAKALGWALADIPGFSIMTALPRLDSAEDMAEFESFLEGQQVEVVAIDPAYLCMGSADSGNLFAQGTLLMRLSEICQRLGITLILCHHTRKNTGRDTFDAPELEDIAWAGFQEFARQWILVGRRERYVPGSGEHRLWLSVGGSAGHGGLWAVDANEGTAQSDEGRFWEVTVASAAEAVQQAEKRKTDAKQKKAEAQLDADVKALVDAALKLPTREGTKTELRELSGLSKGRLDGAYLKAIADGHFKVVEIVKGNNRKYSGVRVINENTV